jgi:hypothetical protein
MCYIVICIIIGIWNYLYRDMRFWPYRPALVPNFFHLIPFKNDGGHCVLGDLQCCRRCLVSCSRSVPRHNPVSELYGQFLWPHGLVFVLTCTVICGTFIYTGVCLSKSCPIKLPQVDSKQVVETPQGWSIETVHTRAHFPVSAEGLNNYVNKLITCFSFGIMGYCV